MGNVLHITDITTIYIICMISTDTIYGKINTRMQHYSLYHDEPTHDKRK